MGYLSRFQGCLLPHTNTRTVQEISKISYPGQNVSVQSSAIRTLYSSHGIYSSSRGGKTDGHTQGFKDPPIPRRLVGESQVPLSLSPAYTRSSKNVSGARLAGEFREIRAGTQTGLRLCRLSVRTQVRSGLTDTGQVAEPSTKSTNTAILTGSFGPAIHVLDMSISCHRETSSPQPTTHETHTVESQKQLESTRVTRKGSNPQVLAPTSTMVAGGKQCASRSTITPTQTMLCKCLQMHVHKCIHLDEQVAPTSNIFICHELQQQVTSVCVTGTGTSGLSSGCTQSAMLGSGCICLPTSSHLGQSGGEVTGLPMQENHSD